MVNRADSKMTPKRALLCWVMKPPTHGDQYLRSYGAANKARRLRQLMSLVFMATVATGFGQAPRWNPHINGPLEKYDNPPGYIYRLETSPRMISPHGVFISY